MSTTNNLASSNKDIIFIKADSYQRFDDTTIVCSKTDCNICPYWCKTVGNGIILPATWFFILRNKKVDVENISTIKHEDDSVKFKNNISAKAKDPGFWREIWQQLRLVFHLIRDPEVPFYLKFLPFLAVVYLFVPVDLVPDFLIGLGQLDDVTILLVGAKIFVELSPQHIVARHMTKIREADGYDAEVADAIIIDGEYEPIPEHKQDR